MSFYQPLQRATDRRWVYACSNGAGTFTVCKCSPVSNGEPGEGHATAEEAVRCYRESELDQLVAHEHPDEKKRCVVCGEWTTTRAVMDLGDLYTQYVACPTHATREHIGPIHLAPRSNNAR